MSRPCYVYAIVGRDVPAAALASVAGAGDLALVPWQELAAVTRRLPDDGPPVTVEAVLHHEAVVEAVRGQCAALPVRFGTVFRDEAAVTAALAEHHDALAADLRRIGDKVEMGLTALWAAPPLDAIEQSGHGDRAGDGAKGVGARYLHARAARFRREDALRDMAREVAGALDLVLGGVAIERRVSLLPTPRVALRAAYLLDANSVTAFRAAFDQVREKHEKLRVLLTGPWPPYSFVRRADAAQRASPDGSLAGLVRQVAETMQGRPA